MGSLLVTNIGELVTNDPSVGDRSALGLLKHAAIAVEDDRVAWVGGIANGPACDETLDVGAAAVVPGFVDSHAHLVFAGDRSREFAARMAGESYSAGGIRTTVEATRRASDDVLQQRTRKLADELLRHGATTIEIKSGYGLDVETEARSVDIASRLTDEVTFMGAHVVPPEFEKNIDTYVALVAGQMLDACAPKSKWIDAFVEEGAFGVEEARTVLTAGADAGLGVRVHANQLGHGPGVQLACELGAASADHCTHLTDDDVDALVSAGVVATLLPGAEFSTRSPYPDARRLIDAGVTVALATDCNPGTSYTTSIPFVIALGVRECGLTPGEALHAATAGGAAALRRDDVGRISVGMRADLVVLDAPTYVHLAYRPGVSLVNTLLRGGAIAVRNGVVV